jgi:hypothetical protein
MTAALMFLAVAAGGCALSEGFLDGEASPAEPDSAAASPAGAPEDAETEEVTTLADVAAAIAAGEEATEVAWSYGFSSISINPDYDPPSAYPPGYNPYNQGDSDQGNGGSDDGATSGSGGDEGSGASDGSDDSDDVGDSDDSGGSGGSAESGDGGGCTGTSRCTWYGGWWPREFIGDVYCCKTEFLEGYGGLAQDRKFCDVSMCFDDAGVPDWIPVPGIGDKGMFRVGVCLAGQSEVHSWAIWIWEEVVVTVVSANYTPTTADVVLEIDLSWFGDYSSVEAWGVHTMHTSVVGDSLTYSSQTHYDWHFWAKEGDPENPGEDFDADATSDYDCSGTLWRP